MKAKEFLEKNIYIFGALFVFLLFFFISKCTPLAGDDWGYAINGRIDNPFIMAYNFYLSWSGRYFSEFYGFIACNNKWLWNIFNPFLFTCIYLSIYKLTNSGKNSCINSLMIIFLIISVEDGIRMETYSWLMGTTYVIPLALSFAYVTLAIKFLNKRINRFIYVMVSNILLFVIGLMMENIAAAMIAGTLIICIYAFINNKPAFRYFIFNFVTSLSAFVILRMSPGTNYRLLRDNVEWSKLGTLDKIFSGYSPFIKMTFLSNTCLIVMLSISVIGLVFFGKIKKSKLNNIFILFVELIALISVLIQKNLDTINFITNESSVFNLLFWPIYIIVLMYVLFNYIDDPKERDKSLLLLVIGGTASAAMLLSPIYGYRSALYTVYYVFCLIIIITNQWLNNKRFIEFSLVLISFLILFNTYNYAKIYLNVNKQRIEREYNINYYREHPEEEEIWLERYPVNTIHGADVDPGDTYHFEVFRQYYELPQSADKIFFYVVE